MFVAAGQLRQERESCVARYAHTSANWLQTGDDDYCASISILARPYRAEIMQITASLALLLVAMLLVSARGSSQSLLSLAHTIADLVHSAHYNYKNQYYRGDGESFSTASLRCII